MSAEAFRAVREMHERAYEQRERTRLLNRLAGIIPFCVSCGAIQEPGEKFEDRIEGLICPDCIDREMEKDAIWDS